MLNLCNRVYPYKLDTERVIEVEAASSNVVVSNAYRTSCYDFFVGVSKLVYHGRSGNGKRTSSGSVVQDDAF